MPLNHRQERFCRAFVQYGAATTAAASAGYARKWAARQGWRLMRVPAIRRRIREIQAEIADDHGAAEAAIIGKLEVVYQRALENHQFYAAARAAELQAKLTRATNARRATDVRLAPPPPPSVSEDGPEGGHGSTGETGGNPALRRAG